MLRVQGEDEVAAPGYAPLSRDAQRSEADSAGVERLNFNVSPAVAAEVRQLAAELDMPMTQLFKYAVSIFKIAVGEARRHRKLVIADENGTVLREFILPGVPSGSSAK
jgi:hypothetical protein